MRLIVNMRMGLSAGACGFKRSDFIFDIVIQFGVAFHEERGGAMVK